MTDFFENKVGRAIKTLIESMKAPPQELLLQLAEVVVVLCRPTVTDQTFSHNSFTGFSGYGIVLEAGYPYDGYWGSMSDGTIDHNQFDLQGPGLDNVAAIALFSNDNATAGPSSLTVEVSHNTGKIKAPGVDVLQNARGGILDASLSQNKITVLP